MVGARKHLSRTGQPDTRLWPALGTFLLAAALALPLGRTRPVRGQSSPAHPRVAFEGRLEPVAGAEPVLKTAGKELHLAATSDYLLHTLGDQRLLSREVRLEGRMRPDGTFEVAHLFTVRDGRLYKVRYYCEVCNIAAVEPGRCVCCQRPTELQEIPVGEAAPDMIVVP